MIRSNFHTHTLYCDGGDPIFAVAEAAVAQGLDALGFSAHSTTFFDLAYCISEADLPHYIDNVHTLQEKYRGKLEIYLGVEDEFHGERPTFERDYTIGSVHYVLSGGTYYPVDESEEDLKKAVREAFGGDFYALTRQYFGYAAQVFERTKCDFVGHFDLVAKYNYGHFDEEDPRYLGPAMEALEHLCKQGAVFEINTGAMARGARKIPYPTPTLLKAMHEFGAPIVLSSDCHDKNKLLYAFDTATELAKSCGYRTARVLTADGWVEKPL